MHHCPDCGQACYCEGDIDDLAWGDDSEEAMNCMHYEQCEKDDVDYEEFEEEEDPHA